MPLRDTSPLVLPVLLLVLSSSLAQAAEGEIYSAPSADEVRAQVLDWVATRGVSDEAVLEEIGRVWASDGGTPSAADLAERAVRTFALVEPEARKLVEACDLSSSLTIPPEPALLQTAATESFFHANLGSWYARCLAQRRMYDEALDVFASVDAKQVIDPAGYFFYRAVCEQGLLMKDEAIVSIERLLKNTVDVPVRYSTVATLMQHDLEALEEKSLDEISRRMRDSERRLDLGRGGQKVQKVQDRIVADLDELIKKMEQQSGGGGGGGGSGAQGQGNQSDSPAEDSVIKGSTAPGEVDDKQFSKEGGWGSLPPKEQAKARNLINRNFPPHYRQAVENYFKKLANRPK